MNSDRALDRPEPEAQSRGAGLRGFGAENGWFLLLQKVGGAAMRRIRDGLLARKLKTSGLKIGRTPRLLGLGHMRVGANLSAGNDLWLEAVTEFGGERFQPRLTIGADCNLSDQVHIGCLREITIGDGFLCGSRVLIIDHGHGRYGAGGGGAEEEAWVESDPEVRPNLRHLWSAGAISIGRNVWIGDGVVVLAGATIGDGAIVGANSVVRGVVPAGTMAAGSPLRLLRRWDGESKNWVKV